MQSAEPGSQKQNKSVWAPWLTAAFLAVLIISTAAVLASNLYSFVHRNENVISLYDGAVTSGQKKATSGSGSTSASKSTGSQSEKSSLLVRDNEKVWKTDTEVELFEVSYQNKNGEITVRSAGSDKVVAPGTDGKYTFTLKNTGDSETNYKVWMEAEIRGTSSVKLPIEAKVSGTSGWLLGDSDNWKELNSLNKVSAKEKLAAGKTSQYTIYWQWPFEREADKADTALGDAAADQEISCTVVIHTQASTSGKESTENGENGTGNGSDKASGENNGTASSHTEGTSRKAAKTADNTDILSWILLLGMTGAVILILLFYRRKTNSIDAVSHIEDRKGRPETDDR